MMLHYFFAALAVMTGIACGLPLLFLSHYLCRRYTPADTKYDEYQQRSIELMEDRNRLDVRKVDALEVLAENTP